MDELQLRALIDRLNSQVDGLHSRDHFWTGLLILGCAFEVITICREYVDSRTDWHKARVHGTLFFPERPPLKWLLFDTLGIILVLAGIGGELHISIVAGRLETQLRDANASLIFLLEERAGVAETSAQGAIDKAEKARTVAGSAAKEAANADNSSAAVVKKAEQVNQALMLAQYLQLPREVRDPDDLKKKLTPFNGKTIFFKSYFDDSDGYFLCRELVEDATNVGVTAVDQCNTVPVRLPISLGINVFAPDQATMLTLNNALAGATPFGSGGGTYGQVLIVFVGRKNTFHIGSTTQTRMAKRGIVFKNADK